MCYLEIKIEKSRSFFYKVLPYLDKFFLRMHTSCIYLNHYISVVYNVARLPWCISTGVIPISLPVLSSEPVFYHTCKNGCCPAVSTALLLADNILSLTITGNVYFQILGQHTFSDEKYIYSNCNSQLKVRSGTIKGGLTSTVSVCLLIT